MKLKRFLYFTVVYFGEIFKIPFTHRYIATDASGKTFSYAQKPDYIDGSWTPDADKDPCSIYYLGDFDLGDTDPASTLSTYTPLPGVKHD